MKKKAYLIISSIILICVIGVGAFFIYNKYSNTNTANDEPEVNSKEEVIDEKKDEAENRFKNLTTTNENIGIPVLYYHSVDPNEENEVTISPEKLKQELQLVKDLGYTTLTMSEVNDYIKHNKPIPKKSILITFDDGYMNNYTTAFPILKGLDMKATIFTISSGIDDGYYMSSDQIKEMSDYGIDIESHTVKHVHLNKYNYDEQLKELKESKEKIESITGKEVLSVAYPFGDYDENSLKAAKDAGYSIAFTTNYGLADRSDNAVALNRIYVSSNYSIDEFKNRLLNCPL